MTTSVEHVLPSDLEIADRSSFGGWRPGNVVTRTPTGTYRSRSYFEYNLRRYLLRFTENRYTDDGLAMAEALLQSTGMNAAPFWVKEPISRDHSAIPGELVVAGQKAYLWPFDGDTSDRVTVGGIPEVAVGTNYWIHSASNVMTDAQANAAGGVTTGLGASGTNAISAVRGPTLDGLHAILVDPMGTVANAGVATTSGEKPAVTDAIDWTAMASFLPRNGTDSFRVGIQYYDGSTPLGSLTYSAGETGTAGEWLHVRFTKTPEANADSAYVIAQRTTSSDENFHVACLGLAPGDFKRWFLPSMAPGVIRFGSTPGSAGDRLVFWVDSAKRWTRVVAAENSQGAEVELLGDSTQAPIRLNEVVFGSGQ
jgi:hypothetical protein